MSDTRGGSVNLRSGSMRVSWGLVAAIAVLGVLTPVARAGSYEVYSCDPSHGSGATPSWDGFHDLNLTVYGQCQGASPEGLVTRSVPGGGGATSSAFQG